MEGYNVSKLGASVFCFTLAHEIKTCQQNNEYSPCFVYFSSVESKPLEHIVELYVGCSSATETKTNPIEFTRQLSHTTSFYRGVLDFSLLHAIIFIMDNSWYQFTSKHNRGNMVLSENAVSANASSSDQDDGQADIANIRAGGADGGLGCSSNLDDIMRRRRRSSSPTSLKVSTASIDVIFPEKEYEPSLEMVGSFSSDSMLAINKSQSADPDFDRGLRATSAMAVEPAPIPRRNLTEAFEELYIKPSKSWANSVTNSPKTKELNSGIGKPSMSGNSNIISPTGVTELGTTATVPSVGAIATSQTTDPQNLMTPIKNDLSSTREKTVEQHEKRAFQFRLHPQLQRDMSDSLVQRVCFYSIIHDINKEATSMASNDESGYNRNPDEANEKYDPLIMAVQGHPRVEYTGSSSVIKTALIDEEQWLLDAIDSRTSDETRAVKACPPTFLQAMGERDYENPLASLSNGSRTQLWKPSRSWWEAKSGKNPWIEPNSHNKRWRYVVYTLSSLNMILIYIMY